MTSDTDNDHDKLIRIYENLKYIRSALDNFEPRISRIEKWRYYISGAIAFFGVVAASAFALALIVFEKVI